MILGMFFDRRYFKRICKGELQWKIVHFSEACARENVDILVFSPESVDWYDKKINGLTYNASSKLWNMNVYPFPDLIYDRATFTEKDKSIGKFVRERFIKDYNIPFLNTKSYFNKWETHNILSKEPMFHKHLPKTQKYVHPFQISEFLSIYKSIYIKDSSGKLGKNIFKIQKADNGLYCVKYLTNKENHSDVLPLEKVHIMLTSDKMTGRKIIIQQGIELARLNDCPFDIRCLVQKNRSMNWEVVDKSIRLALPESIVTNVSSGGQIKRFSEVVPLIFLNFIDISNEIDSLIIAASNYLERTYGTLGELGIDIALDSSGRIWLIEINGKPSKLCIYYSGNQELINKTCTNIVSYSKELLNIQK